MARAGLELPSLPTQSIWVSGRTRTYEVAPVEGAAAPLLVVLHGGGSSGLGMAALTGLAARDPRARFAVVFPNGWGRAWDDARDAPRLTRREGIDDVAFLNALVHELVDRGVAAPGRTVAVGMSNGAFMAEHLARHELLDLTGIALVAGGASDRSRDRRRAPPGGVRVLAFHGTADPLVPYGGGPIGPFGHWAHRRPNRAGGTSGRGVAAPIEQVTAEWATADHCGTEPKEESLLTLADSLAVTRMTWSCGDDPRATLYRIEGGAATPGQEAPSTFLSGSSAPLRRSLMPQRSS